MDDRSAEENPTPNEQRGLYAKYEVTQLDGEPIGECFVLEFKDPNTWPALEKYAETVSREYPKLANDILNLVTKNRLEYKLVKGQL